MDLREILVARRLQGFGVFLRCDLVSVNILQFILALRLSFVLFVCITTTF